MKNIFLAPISNEQSNTNFGSTILDGIPLDFIKDKLTKSESGVLRDLEKIRIWGIKESIKNRWEKIRPGDYILFYKKGVFSYVGTVVFSKYDKELSDRLWGADDNNKSWAGLFFVDNFREVNIPIEVVRDLASYEFTWDRVMGFMSLNEKALKEIATKFGSIDVFLDNDSKAYEAIGDVLAAVKEEIVEVVESKQPRDKDELKKIISEYETMGDGYKEDIGKRRRRVENKKQKQAVAELEDYKCQLCGWWLEWENSKGQRVYRIDVDHIIDKAAGGTEESSNLWTLCPNHHVKKTLGVIKVDLSKHKIYENDKEIFLKSDNHLDW